MCGGYSTPEDWQQLRLPFDAEELVIRFPRREGIRPFDRAPIVRRGPNGLDLREAQWSLVPARSPERRLRVSTFNARIETAAELRTWAHAFRRQRCLVPANGWYERVPRAEGGRKQPYYTEFRDHRAFMFAGLWDRWTDPQSGASLLSYAVVTTRANALMERIGHPRSPALVARRDWETWLDPKVRDPSRLQAMVQTPCPARMLESWPVGTGINQRDRQGTELTAAIGDVVRVDGT